MGRRDGKGPDHAGVLFGTNPDARDFAIQGVPKQKPPLVLTPPQRTAPIGATLPDFLKPIPRVSTPTTALDTPIEVWYTWNGSAPLTINLPQGALCESLFSSNWPALGAVQFVTGSVPSGGFFYVNQYLTEVVVCPSGQSSITLVSTIGTFPTPCYVLASSKRYNPFAVKAAATPSGNFPQLIFQQCVSLVAGTFNLNPYGGAANGAVFLVVLYYNSGGTNVPIPPIGYALIAREINGDLSCDLWYYTGPAESGTPQCTFTAYGGDGITQVWQLFCQYVGSNVGWNNAGIYYGFATGNGTTIPGPLLTMVPGDTVTACSFFGTYPAQQNPNDPTLSGQLQYGVWKNGRAVTPPYAPWMPNTPPYDTVDFFVANSQVLSPPLQVASTIQDNFSPYDGNGAPVSLTGNILLTFALGRQVDTEVVTNINGQTGPITLTGSGVTQTGSVFTFSQGIPSITGPAGAQSGALTFNGSGVTQTGSTFTFSGGGVTSITGPGGAETGALTFNGSGVTQSGSTFTFASSSGVSSITGPGGTETGAITLTGSGVSQSGSTFTISGGGGGGSNNFDTFALALTGITDYWNLGDTSGTTAANLKTSANSGTYRGTAGTNFILAAVDLTEDGLPCVALDGVAGYVELPDPTTNSTSFSWFGVCIMGPNANVGSYATPFSNYDGNGWNWNFQGGAPNTVIVAYAGGTIGSASSPPVAGIPYLLGLTYINGTGWLAYVNGQLIGTNGNGYTKGTSSLITVGRNHNSSPFWQGVCGKVGCAAATAWNAATHLSIFGALLARG